MTHPRSFYSFIYSLCWNSFFMSLFKLALLTGLSNFLSTQNNNIAIAIIPSSLIISNVPVSMELLINKMINNTVIAIIENLNFISISTFLL